MKEIERKWLVYCGDDSSEMFDALDVNSNQKSILQYYLSTEPSKEVRLRCYPGLDLTYLTIKTGSGLERDEIEVPISRSYFSFNELRKARMIHKIRAIVGEIELDYYPDFDIIVAEKEFESVGAASAFDQKSVWFLKYATDVTDSNYYKNKELATCQKRDVQIVTKMSMKFMQVILIQGHVRLSKLQLMVLKAKQYVRIALNLTPKSEADS